MFGRVYTQIQIARTMTREADVAQKIAALNPAQLAVYGAWMKDEMHEPLTKDTPGYVLDGTFVPASFIYRELVPASAGYNDRLVPQHNYSHKSDNRRYYQATLAYLIRKGVAFEPRGNRSAKITSWDDVYEAIRSEA